MYDVRQVKTLQWARSVVQSRHYRPGTDAISLGELISPLRYDILVRAEFFDYLADRLDLFDADFDRFTTAATETRYFTWFSQVALTRYRPAHATAREDVMAQFRERLRRSVRLLRSFTACGFDPRFPISLRAAAPGAASETGKTVSRRFQPGDGCHRLALLVRTGELILPAAYYRVAREPRAALIDNTHLLIRDLGLPREEYVRFLSRGYSDLSFSDAESLVSYVGARFPWRLAELRNVMAIDQRAFAAADPSPAANEGALLGPPVLSSLTRATGGATI